MKRFISILMLLCFSTSMLQASASTVSKEANTHILYIRNIEANEQCQVSDAMTYDEMRARCAEISGIPYIPTEECRTESILRREPGYREVTIRLDVTDEYKPSLVLYFETEQNGQYWAIKSLYSVQLNREYRFLNADGELVSIVKQFSGDIEIWVRSLYEVEYVINGDFYNYGTTTNSGGAGLEVNIGEAAKISFSASTTTSNNHYKYFYRHRTIAVQN